MLSYAKVWFILVTVYDIIKLSFSNVDILMEGKMYLKNISLQNYKGIQNLSVEFKPGLNLLIGNNGAGKTSLLNAIAVALSNTLHLIPVSSFAMIEQSDIHVTTSTMGDATSAQRYHTPVIIDTLIGIGDNIYKSTLVKQVVSSTMKVEGNSIMHHIKTLVDENLPLPLLNYQNSGRAGSTVFNAKTVFGMTLQQQRTARLSGYKNTFNKELNIDDILLWCMQMELTALQKGKEVREYKLFKSIVSTFVQAIDNKAKNPKIYHSFEWGYLVYVDDCKETPFYNLSAGFQSILCTAIELAYRISVLNPELTSLKEQEGIVLIDEIEMHLHPAWQWKILDALKNTFPKVQFIVATHSPIILSSAKDASLFLMKSVDEIISLENAFGYKINDVLELRQGTKDMPEEVSAYYDEAEKLLNAYDKKGLLKLQESIETAYGKDSYVAKSINDFIEVNRWIEEA